MEDDIFDTEDDQNECMECGNRYIDEDEMFCSEFCKLAWENEFGDGAAELMEKLAEVPLSEAEKSAFLK